jgi:DNA-binding IclR family transcriptional regulator
LSTLGLLSLQTDGSYLYEVGLARFSARLLSGVNQAAARHLDEARDATGETAILAVYDGHRRQYSAIEAAESAKPVRFVWQYLSDWTDVHLGATGRAILAFLPAREQETILGGLPDPIPGSPGLSKTKLRRELSQIHRTGFAFSLDELRTGACAVASPIFYPPNRLIAAVVIAWPNSGRNGDPVIRARGRVCRQAALAISYDCGWQPLADVSQAVGR